MNCPKCGKELRQGGVYVHGVWAQKEEELLDIADTNVNLWQMTPKDFLRKNQRWLPTGICEDCRILVSEY